MNDTEKTYEDAAAALESRIAEIGKSLFSMSQDEAKEISSLTAIRDYALSALNTQNG